MTLLMIRHGDPDYDKDSLTETGWKEAEYLAERLSGMEPAFIYVSPLGRAKDTVSLTLDRLGRTAVECDWLREFDAPIIKPNLPEKESITWDWLPQDWTTDERYFTYGHWYETEIMQAGSVREKYEAVTRQFDELLAHHGYSREGKLYRAVQPNNDTVALFCHFGVECVLLGHLLCVSPMVLWHGTCAAPSSVTTLHTEERREGVALFRMSAFGDVSHLYTHGQQPAFAARFCELYSNAEERHD